MNSDGMANLPALTSGELRVLADRLGPWTLGDDPIANSLRTAVAEALIAAERMTT